jgi:hypothetical protein
VAANVFQIEVAAIYIRRIKKIISGDNEVAANDIKKKKKILIIDVFKEQLWEMHQAYL